MSLFFHDPDSPQFMTFLRSNIKLLLPRVQESLAAKLECSETRENRSIPGNAFDRQHARRDSDELHNDSRNLAMSLSILRSEGIEKIGSEEPLQALLLPCFSRKARKKSKRQKNVLCV